MNRHRAYYLAHPEKWYSPEARAASKLSVNTRRALPHWQLDYILRNARTRARKREMLFDDAVIDLAKTPPARCACCGGTLEYKQGQGQNPRSPSIDRLDSRRGYTLDNVAIVCMRCNAIKNDGTAAEHRQIADYIDRFAALFTASQPEPGNEQRNQIAPEHVVQPPQED